jgi:peptidoglycan/LPS O-acetylase OafA/YrhL
MPSFSSHSSLSKLSPRPLPADTVKASFAGQYSTVNCDGCNRTMVPRVISYYGQPLRSICPFCGMTFSRFPSGLQRLMQRFQTRRSSFTAFAWMVVLALGFGMLWWVSDWAILPVNLTLIAALGSVGFGLLALAELFVQGVEHLAAKLSHESSYYWSGLILIAMIIANQRDFMVNYWLMLFSIVLLIRWIVVGSMRVLIRSR